MQETNLTLKKIGISRRHKRYPFLKGNQTRLASNKNQFNSSSLKYDHILQGRPSNNRKSKWSNHSQQATFTAERDHILQWVTESHHRLHSRIECPPKIETIVSIRNKSIAPLMTHSTETSRLHSRTANAANHPTSSLSKTKAMNTTTNLISQLRYLKKTSS